MSLLVLPVSLLRLPIPVLLPYNVNGSIQIVMVIMPRLFIVIFLLVGLNGDLLYSRSRNSVWKTQKQKTESGRRKSRGGILGSGDHNHEYHVGAKGGCYYIDGKGKKQYVERSKCK
jgi:hypothetical protein